MSNVAIFKNGKTPEYRVSVSTGDYANDSEAIINPDISTVSLVATKYWKRSGNAILEMNLSEKQAVDAAELLMRKNQADTLTVAIKEALTALIKVINIRLSLGQKITQQEMIDAIKAEII